MILLGKKVRLRSTRLSDVPMLHKWVNNKKLNYFLGMEIPISLKEERRKVRAMINDKTKRHFIIELRATGEPIGVMSINNIMPKQYRAGTGAFIAYPKYWGEGYGSDAKMVLLRYAFLKLKLNRVESHVFPHNPRSLRYSQKCGYKLEGILRQNVRKHGKFYDSIVLSVLKQDWLKLAKKQGYV